MTHVSELVMPKLGLTMTEGRVAQWMVKPGENFNQGDVIVVIETDKIANDVEAPAAGHLVEILVEEGGVVPVGTVIGKWRLEGGANTKLANSKSENAVSNAPASDVQHGTAEFESKGSGDQRIVATPLARRLAKEAGLDLLGLTGSGPGGRIKAADVERALALRGATTTLPKENSSTPPSQQIYGRQLARLSFATIDIEVDALLAIQGNLAKSGLAYQLRDFMALACIRALASDQSSVRWGIRLRGFDKPACFLAQANETLSSIASKCGRVEQGTDRRENHASEGDIVLIPGDGPLHAFVPAVPAGWQMALGIGSIRRRRVEPDGAQHELSVSLSYDDASRDHHFAGQFLGRIKELLEEPLLLLAS